MDKQFLLSFMFILELLLEFAGGIEGVSILLRECLLENGN